MMMGSAKEQRRANSAVRDCINDLHRPGVLLSVFVACIIVGFEAVEGGRRVYKEESYIFDWDAYMEQASMIASGERNYSRVRGDTGLLVYPGAHTGLHVLLRDATGWDEQLWTTEYVPKNISGYERRTHRPTEILQKIQIGYTVLLAASTALAVVSHMLAGVPLHYILLIVISRRFQAVHSLGLFNDCWCALFMHASVVLAQLGWWHAAVAVWSLAVGVKMNALLLLPGFVALLLYAAARRSVQWAGRGRVPGPGWLQAQWPRLDVWWLLQLAGVAAAVQLLAGGPFLLHAPAAYLAGAFNLGRSFHREFSVSWRFLPEGLFQSKAWHVGLLAAHVGLVGVLLGSQGCMAALHPRCCGGGRQEGSLQRVAGGPSGAPVPSGRASAGTGGRAGAGMGATLRGRGRLSGGGLAPVDRSARTREIASRPGDGGKGARVPGDWATGFSRAPAGSRAAVAVALYGANLVGVTLARSLHYQFIVWYWAGLPALVWAAGVPWAGAVIGAVALEVGWNCHEPQPWSSLLVTLLHLGLCAALVGTRLAWMEQRGKAGLKSVAAARKQAQVGH